MYGRFGMLLPEVQGVIFRRYHTLNLQEQRMNKNRSIAKIITLLGISWFVFWACAPMMSAPPSPPIPDTQVHESGISINGGAMFAENPLGDLAHPQGYNGGALNLQTHYRRPIVAGGEFGLISSIGLPSMIAGGAYYRAPGYSGDIFNIAPQIELGFLWTGFRVPMSVKVEDKVWVTTQPALTAGSQSHLMVPLGISRTLGKGFRLDSEFGVRYELNGEYGFEYLDIGGPWAFMGQVGISYHGKRKQNQLDEDFEETGVSGATILKRP
jgi:hypothetical protein